MDAFSSVRERTHGGKNSGKRLRNAPRDLSLEEALSQGWSADSLMEHEQQAIADITHIELEDRVLALEEKHASLLMAQTQRARQLHEGPRELQSSLNIAAVGRCLRRKHGWTENRRNIQTMDDTSHEGNHVVAGTEVPHPAYEAGAVLDDYIMCGQFTNIQLVERMLKSLTHMNCVLLSIGF